MNVFDLVAKITLDSSSFESGLASAGEKAKGFASGAMNVLGGLAQAGAVAFGAATTALVGFGASAVKTGAEFDSSMSQVAATLGYTTEEIEKNINGAGDAYDALREKAEEAGRSTIFSASESAEGLNILAMSGYDATQSIEMLDDVLHLAAAGNMDMASAASYVSGAMKGFNDETKDSAYYADLMAKGATLANTSVSQLGDAMSSGAAGAAAYNQSADSMTVALLRLAEQGETGAAAGTALAAAMKNIYTPTDQARKALEKLGVEAFDKATGEARDFNTVINELEASMAGMTDEQKASYKQTIFGIQGLDAYNKMVVTSAEKQEEWANALAHASDEGGEAARQYNTMTDNLEGDVKAWQSALDGFKIAVSDGLMPSVREFVQFGTEGLSKITDAFKSDGLTGAMDAFGTMLSDGLSMIIGKIPEVVSAAGQLLAAFGSGLIASAPVLYDSAVQVVNMLLNNLLEASQNLGGENTSDKILQTLLGIGGDVYDFTQIASEIITNFMNAFATALPSVLTGGASIVAQLINGIANSAPQLVTSAANVIAKFGEGLKGAVNMLLPAFTNLLTNGLKALTNPQALGMVLKSAADLVKNIATGIIEAIPEIVAALPEIIQNIVTFFTDSIPVIINLILDIWEAIMDNLPTIIEAIVEALPMIIESILNGWIDALPLIIEGFVRLVGMIVEHLPEITVALIEAIPALVDSLVEAFASLGDKLGTYFHEVFTALGQIISDWWEEKKQQIAEAWASFSESVKTWFDELPYNLGVALGDMIAKFFEWFEDAKDWVENDVPKIIDGIIDWFKGLPEKVWTWLKAVIDKLTTWVKDMKKKISEEVPKIIDHIAEFFEELPEKALEWGKDMIQGFIDGIKSMAEAAWNSIAEFTQGIRDRLGHSHPKIGALADDYKWMPDMMELFAEGIKDNSYKVYNEVEKSLDFSDAVQAPIWKTGNIVADTKSGMSEYDREVLALLKEIADKENVVLAPEAKEIFRVVDDENRIRTKATGYNPLSMRRV